MFKYTAWLAGLAFGIASASAADLPYKPIAVTTPDGVHIAAQEWGNPAGPEIVFIHGFAQSHLTWVRQVTAPELAGFRMITYDLRGHGDSDKPLDRAKYQDSKLWSDELQAVIDAAGLKHPVLVPWSYGGRIVSDYLAVHGPGGLAGIDFVDAVTNADPKYFGKSVGPFLGGMVSPDLATNIASTIAFLHACFEQQPSEADFQTILGFNMVVPVQVRANMGGRKLDIDALLRSLKLPVLVTHGDHDRIDLYALGQYTAATIPGAKLSTFEGAGHASFFEQAPRFNRELAEFVTSVTK
jgi:pimeloyl-ACP methyl ester carboxylesterase